MSNDQQQKPNLITPTVLQVSAGADQMSTSLKFINDQSDWKIKVNSPQLMVINHEQAVISIKTIRNLISELAYAPHLGQSRVFLLLSAEQLSAAAQHAFLKSLEEPPASTWLILVTTNPDQLLSTIKSRCLLKSYLRPTTAKQIKNLPSTLEALFTNPKKTTYSELIKQATEIKDKETALQLAKELLAISSKQPLDSKPQIKIQQQLLKTIDQINKNANLKLALESCFFRIRTALSE